MAPRWTRSPFRPSTVRRRQERTAVRTARPARAVVGGLTAAVVVLLAGCTAPPLSAPPDRDSGAVVGAGRDAANVRWTAEGVPHVTATSWRGLGVGQGYATATDRMCTIVETVLTARGELARWFGPGPDDAHLNSDLTQRHLRVYADADRRWADQPAHVAEMIDGYVAGINAYLTDVGPAGVDGWCAGQPWVAPITVTDFRATLSATAQFASAGALVDEIATAQPPGAGVEAPAPPLPSLPLPSETSPPGSNGWALGAERTGGGGLLLANPHFPWEGPDRFTEVHLTLPGELDVYGASLGLPGVQIGFTDDVAWTHTVSAGDRFTVSELTLDPADPTRYRYGDEVRSLVPDEITVDVLGPDGALTPVRRTLWSSHDGPMVALGPWTEQVAYSLRDANAATSGSVAQWLAMDAADDLDALQAAHTEHGGLLWVNTIATDRTGRAWYADSASTPALSQAALDRWAARVAAGGSTAEFAEQGVVLLDGADPGDAWEDRPGAPAPGLVPVADAPQLERGDYVFNANDSFRLTNPRQLLDGYSPLHGRTQDLVSARTRTNIALLEEPGTGPEGLWSGADVEAAFWSNRSVLPELLRDPLVATCRAAGGPVDPDGDGPATAVDLTPACAALADWSGRYDVDARGALLWREFLAEFTVRDRHTAGPLFADAADPAELATTPRVPVDDAVQRDRWLPALATALTRLTEQGIAPDAPLGQWQYDGRVGAAEQRIALPGGSGEEGVANVMACCSGYVSPSGGPAAGPTPGPGYPTTTGASFVMVVDFTAADGAPRARGLLTYGNSDVPTDPAWTAGTRAFGAEQLRELPLREADVAAATVRTETVRG